MRVRKSDIDVEDDETAPMLANHDRLSSKVHSSEAIEMTDTRNGEKRQPTVENTRTTDTSILKSIRLGSPACM
uniref:Uncharacterized protein n=1 Tax=Ditylenchus dipsaci TaxID=166011 RepID=A0A915DH96_9BILA